DRLCRPAGLAETHDRRWRTLDEPDDPGHVTGGDAAETESLRRQRGTVAPMEPAEALERIVYLLDRVREKPYRVRAYLRAAEIVKALPPDEVVARVAAGTLEELDGIGPKTAAIISEVATT